MTTLNVVHEEQINLALGNTVILRDFKIDVKTAGVYRFTASLSGWSLSNGASFTIKYNNGKETVEIVLTRVTTRSSSVDLCIHAAGEIEVHISATMETTVDIRLEKVIGKILGIDDVLPKTDKQLKPYKHLFIMQHGNHGTAQDLYDMGENLRATFHASTAFTGHELWIMYPKSNEWLKTHDGIQVCSKRMVEEVITFCNHFITEGPVLCSVVGHSLGGLILRNAAPLLLDSLPALSPVSFMTISTPHLGARKAPNDKFSANFMRQGADIYMNYLLGQTGKELCLSDAVEGEKPLLDRMSEPNSTYINALNKFRTKTAVGAAHYDTIVPHSSALIASHAHSEPPVFGTEDLKVSSLSGFGEDDNHDHMILFENQKQVVFVDPIHDKVKEKAQETPFLSDSLNQTEFMYDILKNLQLVNWRRISLEFSLENWRQALGVHDMTINKQQKKIKAMLSQKAVTAPARCVSLLVRVLLIDHFKACCE
jgi:hypothetical protein